MLTKELLRYGFVFSLPFLFSEEVNPINDDLIKDKVSTFRVDCMEHIIPSAACNKESDLSSD